MAEHVGPAGGRRLAVSSQELDLDRTLGSGQAFLWRRDSLSGSWTGPLGNKLFTLQRVNQDELVYWTKPSSPSLTEQDECDLKDYFRLEHSLVFLYQFWAKRDENFSTKSLDYGGVRLLSQRPLEALLSFITSSNNNIHRIQSLMRKMCHAFGDNLGSHGDQDYHSFPSLSQLCGDGVEQKLRELGFGYRAKYIHQTTVKLSTELGGEAWLNSLRQRSYHDAWQLLQQFPGVGGKVADCVCLMGLGHLEAVPVDVHISRIASRDYGSCLPQNLATVKSLSTSNYKLIGDHFRSLFGDKAGWAQAVLFTAEVSENSLRTGLGSKGKRSLQENSLQSTKKVKLQSIDSS